MIEANIASSNRPEKFQDYDDLFEHIIELENQKMLERRPDFKSMQWSFTTYAPHHVQTLYTHLKSQNPVVRHASENQLPLIEICSGDFTNLEYVVGTENTKISYLKKKWALAYCASHGISIAVND